MLKNTRHLNLFKKGVIIMIPRLKDLISEHKVILYTVDGGRFDQICNNIFSAQKLVNQQNKCKYVAGYAIEKVQKNIGLNINHH